MGLFPEFSKGASVPRSTPGLSGLARLQIEQENHNEIVMGLLVSGSLQIGQDG